MDGENENKAITSSSETQTTTNVVQPTVEKNIGERTKEQTEKSTGGKNGDTVEEEDNCNENTGISTAVKTDSPGNITEVTTEQGTEAGDVDPWEKKTIERESGEIAESQKTTVEHHDPETPAYDRAELMEKYQSALAEQRQLKKRNLQLQNRLAEYLRKKKTDDNQREQEKTVTHQEQRYQRYLANITEMKQVIASDQERYEHELEEVQKARELCLAQVKEELEELQKLKRDVARVARNSRTGRPIPAEDLENYLIREKQKETELEEVRLEHIKLRNRLQKQESELRAKEGLGDGLHLIDFEQLKIENQTYCDKIEERDEELNKLRKKISSTVQVLAHLKEKLQFVQTENELKHRELKKIETIVTAKRAALTVAKQKLDALRNENMSLHQRCGLLGHTALLQDFEESHDEVERLQGQLSQLQLQYREDQLSLDGLRRKIQAGKKLHNLNSW